MKKNEATKKEMRAEALLRMRLLKLSNETIKAFEEENQVMVSDQVSLGRDPDGYDDSGEIGTKDIYLTYGGVVWSLNKSYPTEKQLQLVKEIEEDFDVLVYHIHRCQINDEMNLIAFLVVGNYKGDWEYTREMTEKGLPDYVVPIIGYEVFEYSIMLPVKPSRGCLLRTS